MYRPIKPWCLISTSTAAHSLWNITKLRSCCQLAVDKNYHTNCPRVLYRASDDRQVFPKIRLDQVDLKHVYVPFQNQVGENTLNCITTLSYWCILKCCYVVMLVFFVLDKACACVKVQHIHKCAGLLVCTGSILCVVQLWKQVREATSAADSVRQSYTRLKHHLLFLAAPLKMSAKIQTGYPFPMFLSRKWFPTKLWRTALTGYSSHRVLTAIGCDCQLFFC